MYRLIPFVLLAVTSGLVLAQSEEMLPTTGEGMPAQTEERVPAASDEMPAPTDDMASMASDDAPAPAEGFSRGTVARAVFTTGISEREPADQVTTLDPSHNEIYFFSELLDMGGHTARHRWAYEGEVVAEVDFNVRGPRWRVWSSKKLDPAKKGIWTVSVVNTTGEELKAATFKYADVATAETH